MGCEFADALHDSGVIAARFRVGFAARASHGLVDAGLPRIRYAVLVNNAVAVIVLTIGTVFLGGPVGLVTLRFHGVRIALQVALAANALEAGIAVAPDIVHGPVAVVVDSVADFLSSWEDGRVCIVAIALAHGNAVVISIRRRALPGLVVIDHNGERVVRSGHAVHGPCAHNDVHFAAGVESHAPLLTALEAAPVLTIRAIAPHQAVHDLLAFGEFRKQLDFDRSVVGIAIDDIDVLCHGLRSTVFPHVVRGAFQAASKCTARTYIDRGFAGFAGRDHDAGLIRIGESVFVHDSIAVVVCTVVADLGAWLCGLHAVFTVPIARSLTHATNACQARVAVPIQVVYAPIAVVVDTVANLLCTREDGPIVVVTVAVADGYAICVPVGGEALTREWVGNADRQLVQALHSGLPLVDRPLDHDVVFARPEAIVKPVAAPNAGPPDKLFTAATLHQRVHDVFGTLGVEADIQAIGIVVLRNGELPDQIIHGFRVAEWQVHVVLGIGHVPGERASQPDIHRRTAILSRGRLDAGLSRVGNAVLIGEAVAIIVQAIAADLLERPLDRGADHVESLRVAGEISRAADSRQARFAVTGQVVDRTVAIVIQAVTYLFSTGEDRRVRIVAIPIADREAVTVRITGQAFAGPVINEVVAHRVECVFNILAAVERAFDDHKVGTRQQQLILEAARPETCREVLHVATTAMDGENHLGGARCIECGHDSQRVAHRDIDLVDHVGQAP